MRVFSGINNIKSYLFISCFLCLTSCVPLLVTGGVGIAGVSLRNKEGFSGTVSDNMIHADILGNISNASLFKKIEVSVKHSRVLLIGYVNNSEQKRTVIDIATNAEGVKEVIDEIKIGTPSTLEDAAHDTWITSRIKSAMAFEGNVHALNFNVTTYNGVVYLLGIAYSKLEADLVVNIARSTSYVKKVVSYINLINIPDEK